MDLNSIEEFAKISQGELSNFSGQKFEKISTDTRSCQPGDLFVAFQGDNFDAHDFLDQAVAKKVSGLVISNPGALPSELNQCAVILVDSTLVAYQSWAKAVRRTSGANYVAVTGSNGKTTTKEYLRVLLGDNTFANRASFNNHWGVPMTLIAAGHSHRNVVVEIGMNHAGEIRDLIQLANPNTVCLTNVGNAHLEFFESADKLAEAKEETYIYANAYANAVFNLDQARTRAFYIKYRDKFKKSFTFSTEDTAADVSLSGASGSDFNMQISGKIGGISGEVLAPIIGEHNCSNLAAASACALASGVDPEKIWQRIPHCKSEWGRLMLEDCGDGKLLFDAYNANPDSFKALITTLDKMNPKRVFGIFGQMAELGTSSDDWHFKIGQRLSKIDFEKVFFIGQGAAKYAQGYGKKSEVLQNNSSFRFEELKPQLAQGDLVVVKGSRSAALEELFPEGLVRPRDQF